MCAHPGCPEIVPSGLCDAHRQAKRDARSTTLGPDLLDTLEGPLYLPPAVYGRAWRKVSKRFLAAHPFCVDCIAEGNPYGLATEVDHQEPHRGDRAKFWDETNWASRCKSHHSRKTAREVGFSGFS